MKKKGFTLIEVIISITLISMIAIISIVTLKKDNYKDEEKVKVKYVEGIRLETAIYIENNNDINKFSKLKDPGDFVYIQLKDLISEGILPEEEYNPYRGGTNKEHDYDLVKVYLDNESNVDIVYPTEYIDNTKEEIQVILNEVFIKLKDNNEENNQVILPSSKEVLADMNEEINSGAYTQYTFMNKVQSGEYYKYNEAGYYLEDYNGNEISTTDWCIEEEFNEDTFTWKFTYSICEDSELWETYQTIHFNGIERNVKLIDNDAPILLEYNDKHEYGESGYYDYLGYIYSEEYDYCDMYSFTYSGYGYEYYIFDNLDGNKGYLVDYIYYDTYCDGNHNYEGKMLDTPLIDRVGNERIYTINLIPYYNYSPWIEYYGSDYYYDYDFWYDGNNNLQPIYDNIEIYDDYDYDLVPYYYLYDGYNYYGPWQEYQYPYSGTYTLYVEVWDNMGANSYRDFPITVDYYYYPDYYPEDDYYYDDYYYDDYYDDYCGDACIIEQMKENSEAWWGADEETRDWLHEQNEMLADQLSGNAYYTEDGYWHTDDGYLYGDDYYNDYYYDDYYYDDYYYNDYYYDDYYYDDYYYNDYYYDDYYYGWY